MILIRHAHFWYLDWKSHWSIHCMTQSVVQSIQIGLQCLLWDGTIVGSSRANVEETKSRRQTVWMYFMLLFQQLLLVCSQKIFINCKQWSKWSDLSAKIRQVIKLYVTHCQLHTGLCEEKKHSHKTIVQTANLRQLFAE